MALSVATRLTLITCYSLVFLVGLTMNLCTIVVVATSRRLRKCLSNILISNLAVADFLICMISAPYYATGLAIYQPEKPGPNLLEIACKSFVLTAYSLGFTRILLLAVISMERYVAILHPFLYQKYVFDLSGLQTIVICGYAWFQAFVTSSPGVYMKGWVKYKGTVGKLCEFSWEDRNLSYIVPVFLINFAIPVAVIIFTNSKVYSTAKHQRKRIAATLRVRETGDESCLTSSIPRERKKDRKRSRIGSFIPSFFKRPHHFQQGISCVSEDRVSTYYPADQGPNDRELVPYDSKDRQKPDSMIRPIDESLGGKHGDRRILSLRSSPKEDVVVHDCSDSCDGNPLQGDWHEDGHNVQKLDITTEQQNEPVFVFRVPTIENTGPDANNRDDGLPLAESRLDHPSKQDGKKPPRLMQFLVSETSKRRSQYDSKKRPRSLRNNDYVVFFSTLSVVTLFLLTWLPYIITTILILVVGIILPVEVDMFVTAFTVVDSAVTPFIVFGTRREFRKQLLRKVWKRSWGASSGM